MASAGGTDQRRACVANFRDWLERLGTGCFFANILSSNALVHYEIVAGTPSAQLIEPLDAAIDQAAAANQVAVILLPELHSPGEIAEVLRVLQSGPRWRVQWIASEFWAQRRFAAIRVDWETSAKELSSVVGFSPLRCMPITRRAPYVAMAVWPAERPNQYSKVPAGDTLGIADAKHGLEPTDYDNRWKKTRGTVKEMFLHESENANLLRDVAFRLPFAVVDGL